MNTEDTYKLLRVMRKVMLQRARELLALVVDRRHAADNEAKRAAPKGEWPKLSRILANMRDRRGKLMPGWVTVRLKPIYTVKSQLGQWHKLRRLQVVMGGQRGIMSYFAPAPRTRTARDTQAADDGPAAAATAAPSPAATAAGQTATAATARQLRRLAKERIYKQKDKRRRQHHDDDPDGATSESPALAEIDTACADHDATAASAALPGVATAAPQTATAATADPSKRQLTVAESFQRATRRRTDDPGNAARPPSDAPPLTTATPSDHPDPLPPHEPPPPIGPQRPHRRPNLHLDTTQQRTGQFRAHPQVHDDGPDIAAVAETEVAAPATEQPRV